MDKSQKINFILKNRDKLSSEQQSEVYKIIMEHNISHTKNKNGVFINLEDVNDAKLTELHNYINFSIITNNKLKKRNKKSLKKIYAIQKKIKIEPDIISTNINNTANYITDTKILLKKNKKNVFEGSKINKIIINIGVKDANINANKILAPLLITKMLTQQQPLLTKAKKSIANFKLREGKIIGCKTTLRNKNMDSFLEKLVHIIIPQITDNKILRYKNRRNKNHITLGLNDCLIFPELENQYDLLTSLSGVEITISSEEKTLNKDNLFFSGLKIKFQ